MLNREEGGTQGGTMPWVFRGHKRASQLHWASNLAHQEEMVCLKEIRSNDVDLFLQRGRFRSILNLRHKIF